MTDAIYARIEPLIDRHADGCWLWLGARIAGGYAQLNVKRDDGRWIPIRVHRFMYERFRGPIPDGLVLDHLCRRRACINPWHLEAVTSEENTRRGDAAKALRSGRCKRGHELVGDNVVIRLNGRRRCVPCSRINTQTRWRALHPVRRTPGEARRAWTHCKRGHPFDEANTYRPPKRPDARYCRACRDVHQAKARAA
jgi:hypothetical protein